MNALTQNSEQDRYWMQRALELARRGIAVSSPNPAVGCVILDRAGQVAGEGWHEYDLVDHAEVVALKAAQHAGERLRGGTAYVTLEPCNHTGRTASLHRGADCRRTRPRGGRHHRSQSRRRRPRNGRAARGGDSDECWELRGRSPPPQRGLCALEPASTSAGADEGGHDAGRAHRPAAGHAPGCASRTGLPARRPAPPCSRCAGRPTR